MVQQKHNSNPNSGDMHSVGLLVAVLMIGVMVQKFGPIVTYFVDEHWFLLLVLSAYIIWGLVKLVEWKWRKNNPEKYRRKQILGFFEKLWRQPGSILVGNTLKDERGICLSPEMRTGHVQILGATGRGKTKSVIVPWFLRDIRNGVVPILIDGKGDSSILDEIIPSVPMANGRVCHFDPGNPIVSCTINPLEGGSPHEIADRLFAALEFESSYFEEVQYATVLSILEFLEHLGEVPTLKGLYQALSNPQILLDRLPKQANQSEHLSLELMKLCQMKPIDREERFSGILSQLRPFATGVFEKLVNSTPKQATHLSLNDAMELERARAQGIAGVVILLPTMQFQKTAKVLGKLILQSLAWSTAKRKNEEQITSLFIDEFSAFVYDGFEQFLNKARSKQVALHLSHQSMGDLESVSPSFAKTVNVNTNVKVLLGLNDPDTADYFARHLGTFTTTKETERASRGMWGGTDKSGEMSIRAVEEYKIHPNRLKSFSRGQGVLSLLVNGQPFVEEVQFDARKSA